MPVVTLLIASAPAASQSWINFASSRISFVSPRLLLSKRTPHCHFLLRHIRLFNLKYIPDIILTHSVHWTKTLSKKTFNFFRRFKIAPLIVALPYHAYISQWRHLSASFLIGSLKKFLREYLLSLPQKNHQCCHGLFALSMGECYLRMLRWLFYA